VKRKGITLLEVLMAIFIMGIGMVSVFAIFPVAALMMGQAIEKYQINEVVNNTQSNFDPDVLEFVKNQPNLIFSGGVPLNSIPASFLNFTGLASASPQYLFLDQAAGPARTFLCGVGVRVAYIYDGITPPSLINERYFTSNFDIELDESGRAVTPVSSVGRYSVSFLLEKKPPLDNPLPSRRYMLVYKGRSQTFADFSFSFATLSANTGNAIIVANSNFSDACKKNDWVMVVNTLGERTFHQIQNINGTELELRQKFGAASIIQGVFLLSDVVRVIDMGAG
jgi:prepilin-type N-terminal cleavage/methylation domain-containing protein